MGLARGRRAFKEEIGRSAELHKAVILVERAMAGDEMQDGLFLVPGRSRAGEQQVIVSHRVEFAGAP